MKGGTKGFTLIELILALTLSTMVLIGVMSMFTPVLNSQVIGFRKLSTQADALLAYKSLSQMISQSSEIYLPGKAGAEGDALSGCANFDSIKGTGAAGVIDEAFPKTSFYFCAAGGTLYSYAASGDPSSCPMPNPQECGKEGASVLAKGVSHVPGFPGFFARPPGTPNVIEVHYQVVSHGVGQAINTAVAYQGSR